VGEFAIMAVTLEEMKRDLVSESSPPPSADKKKRGKHKGYEDEEVEKREEHYIHKYSQHIPLAESVVVAGQPAFLQLVQNNGKKEIKLSTRISLENGSKIDLLPKDEHSYLCQPYVFQSKEELEHYVELANGISNFDPLYKLVKTIISKFIDAEDHYLTLLAADIIYTYFQDKFGTTHYLMCVGDNSSGKNSILITFANLAYRVLLATAVSAPNVYTFLGGLEECQGTIAEDEVNDLDNDPDKLNIYKSGYSRGSGKVPKIDLSSGRVQGVYLTYCFKIFASERSLKDSKARGLLDRSFEMKCLVGRPKYNIKEVFDSNNVSLKNELDKTRKLLFAYRMLHHDDIIGDIRLNIVNREAELTKPLIRLFQNSKGVLKDLLPALSKCLNTKRKVKSNSLESYLYATVRNLVPNHGYTIDNMYIMNELKQITDGEDIPGLQAFYSQDLGKVTIRKVTDTLVDKFRGIRTVTGRDNERKRGIMFTKEDLDQKGKEYNVPDEIEILEPIEADNSEIDTFDQILSNLGSEGSEGSEIEGVNVNEYEKYSEDEKVDPKVPADSDSSLTHTVDVIPVIPVIPNPIQNHRTFVAVSKTKLDTGDSKKHDIYWAGSQWYCNNCNKHGDKPYMTKETVCKGEGKNNPK
jgi:hypothetical protein